MKLLVLLVTLGSTAVLSAPLPGPLEEQFNLPSFTTKQENHEEKFVRVDQNNDKRLDFNEFLHMELAYVEAKREEFDSLDKDKDGIVTLKEYEEHYHGVTSRSEARRSEYFAKVFQDFDEDFDMALNQDEVERVLAERFLVKPRENFPRLFYTFDHDHSGGLDLTEYMKFDASFPFDQTDPIVSELTAEHDKPSGQRVTSNRGAASRQGVASPAADAADANAIAAVMSQAANTITPQAPPKAAALPIFNSVHQTQQGNNGPSVFSPTVQLHPVEPGPTRPALPIVKLAKASKSI